MHTFFFQSAQNIAAASAAAVAPAKDSAENQLSIDRVYKDITLKELTLERQKVREVTHERNKFRRALEQAGIILRLQNEMQEEIV